MFQMHISPLKVSPGRSGVSCDSAVCLLKIQGKKGDEEEEFSVICCISVYLAIAENSSVGFRSKSRRAWKVEIWSRTHAVSQKEMIQINVALAQIWHHHVMRDFWSKGNHFLLHISKKKNCRNRINEGKKLSSDAQLVRLEAKHSSHPHVTYNVADGRCLGGGWIIL